MKVFHQTVWTDVVYMRMCNSLKTHLISVSLVFSFVSYGDAGNHGLQVRLREIPVLDKLQYLYSLLSSVLPVVQQIHYRQLSEVEVEKRLQGKIGLLFFMGQNIKSFDQQHH